MPKGPQAHSAHRRRRSETRARARRTRPYRRLPGLPGGARGVPGGPGRGQVRCQSGRRSGMGRGRMERPDGPRRRGGKESRREYGRSRRARVQTSLGGGLGPWRRDRTGHPLRPLQGPVTAAGRDAGRKRHGRRVGKSPAGQGRHHHGLAGDRAPSRLVPRQEFRLSKENRNEKDNDRHFSRWPSRWPSSCPRWPKIRPRRPRPSQQADTRTCARKSST